MKSTKVISTLAAAVVSVASLSTVAMQLYAADDVTVSVGSVEVEAGAEFSVDIELSNVPAAGIAGLEFAVKYDSSLVTVTTVTEGSISKTGASEAELDKDGGLADSAVNGSYSALSYDINTKNSVVNLIWLTGLDSSDYYIKKDGVFVTISGKVNADASGKAELEVVPISRTGISGSTNNVYVSIGGTDKEIVPKIKNGTVTIKSAGSEAPVTESSAETTTESSAAASSESQGGTSSEATMLGDATCDKVIDVRDVALISQHLVKLKTLTGEGFANADVNANGKVEISDLTHLKRFLIKDIAKL